MNASVPLSVRILCASVRPGETGERSCVFLFYAFLFEVLASTAAAAAVIATRVRPPLSLVDILVVQDLYFTGGNDNFHAPTRYSNHQQIQRRLSA